MKIPLHTDTEIDRLDALKQFDIVDTESEQDFDDITELASHICDTPISLISLIDIDRQWFKSKIGLQDTQTHRDISFCGHAIHDNVIFEIPDALKDERFFDNSLVTGEPHIRFYAGAPLITQSGFKLGTLCVIDRIPKTLTQAQRRSLETLSRQVVRQMEFRQQSRNLALTAQNLANISALQTAVLNSPDLAMISVNLSGEIVSFSTAAEELLAIKASEVISLRKLDSFYSSKTLQQRATALSALYGTLIHPDFSFLTHADIDGFVGGGQWSMLRGDGQTIFVQVGLSAVTNSEEKRIGYLAILHDVSALKQAESLVEESQIFLRKIAERVPGVIYQFRRRPNGTSCFPYASSGLQQLYGLRPDEVSENASVIYSRIHPDDLNAAIESIDQSATNLSPWQHENRVQLPDGSVRWVYGNAIPERESDGSILWHGFITDITKQKEAELALKNNQIFLETLIANLPVGIYCKRMRREDRPGGGKYLIWNAAAERMSGINANRVVNRTDREVFPIPISDMHAEHDRELMQSKQSVVLPKYISILPDGSKRLLRMTSIPLFDSVGEVEFTMGISEDITELLQQQREIIHRKAELEAVNDASPIGLFRTDIEGSCTYVNHTYEMITGLSAKACLGQGWHNAIHPDDVDTVLNNWALSTKTDQPYSGTHRCVHSSGKTILVRVNSAAVKVGGDIVGYVGTVDDITSRRAANEMIAASEKRLRLITNNIPGTIGYINAGEVFEFCNVHYQTMLGLNPEAMVGKTVRQAFGSATYDIIEHNLKSALSGKNQSFERAIKVRGLLKYHQCEYISDVDSGGQVLGFYALVTDVTARKIAETSLVETEHRLRAITANIPALVAHIDKDERYLFVNDKLAQQFNKPASDIVGLSLAQIQPPALYAANKHHLEAVLAGEATIFENQSDISGVYRYYQVSYIPDKNDNDVVTGFYAMVIDITERKTNELRQAANEKRLKTITNNIPVAISYIDRDRRFQFANSTLYSWTRTNSELLIGQLVKDVLGGEVYEERVSYFDQVLAGQQVGFLQTSELADGRHVLQSTYIPDIAEDGEILGFYTLSNDISDLKKTEEDLIRLARFDSLTGLKNRSALFETIHAAIARCQRANTALVVMYLDIDFFKSINDTLGHAKGDLVLQEFARRLTLSVRTTDTVARLGGDEFVIVLELLKDVNDAREIAQKVLENVRAPWLLNGEKLAISTSIGAIYDQSHQLSPGDLLKNADECLYRAKQAGRDQCCFKD